jgi:hypothetical protein
MKLDTLQVDVDRQECSVVFRGSVSVPSAEILPRLDLAVGVGAVSMPAPSAERLEDGTLLIDSADVAALRKNLAPFALAEPRSPRPAAPEIPGAPWAAEKVLPAPTMLDALATTCRIGPGLKIDEAPAVEVLMPKEAPPPVPPAPPAPKSRDAVWAPSPATQEQAARAPFPPPKSPPAAAQAVRGNVYGRFAGGKK